VADRCATCGALATGICSALAGAELDELSALGHSRRLAPGQALLWEGENSAAVASIRTGLMKLTTVSAEGREQIVGLAHPGDFIGRPFAEAPSYSAVALGEVQLCMFGRQEFERFLGQHPQLAVALLRRTLDDLDRARRTMLLLGRGSAEQRVAALLLTFARNVEACARFDLPLGRQEMADVLGLTIETVSRQLTQLRRDGVIDLAGRRGVILTRADQLEALAA
jgi:CRP/FNR family transcriptional regulator